MEVGDGIEKHEDGTIVVKGIEIYGGKETNDVMVQRQAAKILKSDSLVQHYWRVFAYNQRSCCDLVEHGEE